MTISELPAVVACTAETCAYNHDGCHAPAITVGGDGAGCATFLPLDIDGGLPRVLSHVGACGRTDCVHNSSALCMASEVRISGTGTAHCETYEGPDLD